MLTSEDVLFANVTFPILVLAGKSRLVIWNFVVWTQGSIQGRELTPIEKVQYKESASSNKYRYIQI